MKIIILIFVFVNFCLSSFADTTTSYQQKDSSIIIVTTIKQQTKYHLPGNKIFSAEELELLVKQHKLERLESNGMIVGTFPAITQQEHTSTVSYQLDTTEGAINSTILNQTEKTSWNIVSSLFFVWFPILLSVVAGIYGTKNKALGLSLLALCSSVGMCVFITITRMSGHPVLIISNLIALVIIVIWILTYGDGDYTLIKITCVLIAISQFCFVIYATFSGSVLPENSKIMEQRIFLDYFLINLLCFALLWITRWITLFAKRKKLKTITDVIIEVDV